MTGLVGSCASSCVGRCMHVCGRAGVSEGRAEADRTAVSAGVNSRYIPWPFESGEGWGHPPATTRNVGALTLPKHVRRGGFARLFYTLVPLWSICRVPWLEMISVVSRDVCYWYCCVPSSCLHVRVVCARAVQLGSLPGSYGQ